MKRLAKFLIQGCLVGLVLLPGCTTTRPAQSPDVVASVRKAIEQAGLRGVTVKQDRAKGIVTLGGHVATESEKAQAEAIATPLAMGQVVAMEVAVVPVGAEKDARAINSAIDDGIKKNLDAVLISRRLDGAVKHEVKNAVVTLKGDVGSQATRDLAEKLAAEVPYVQQVVNTIQVKGQKATSTQE